MTLAILEKHKWARLFLLVIIFPSLLSYLHLKNWLQSNTCVLRRFSDGSVDLLCRSRRISLTKPRPSIVQISQSLVTDSVIPPKDFDVNIVEEIAFFPLNTDADGNNNNNSSVDKSKYGFRRNKRKAQQSQKLLPISTWLFAFINVALFLYYWNYRVDHGLIVHNSEIVHDYGRSFTSTFGHFEIWHLGFNMMTTLTLGEVLEQAYGSIPFLIYTMAFVPITTLVIVALEKLFSNSPRSMVGFSGILFSWSVVATLSSQSTCPIPFLSELCFNTYRVFGMNVSLGPLVQLVFLQVALPRVSFFGHLAGIIVGFLWHWNVLPPLEFLQPCISYPIIWIVGKVVLQQRSSSGEGNTLGGGNGGALAQRLEWTRNLMILHCLVLFHQFGFNSIALSELLAIIILSIMVQKRTVSDPDFLGVLGRGYVVLIIVIWFTDSMTLTAWFLFRKCTTSSLLLILCRWVLWFIALSMVCQMLHSKNQKIPGSVWMHTCGWLVLEPCRRTGSWLTDYRPGIASMVSSSRSTKLPQQTPSLEDPEVVSHVV